jgi:hypothetical protein
VVQRCGAREYSVRPRRRSGACAVPFNVTARRQQSGTCRFESRRFDAFSSNRRERMILWAFDHGGSMRYDEALIDEAVLAVLYLTAWQEHGLTRAWKGVDWEATNRLHERGLIDDPKSKSKSVIFTEEGLALARAAAERLFSSKAHQ